MPVHTPVPRRAAAAMEFVIVASLLFMIFLAMIEIGRALMALGAVGNAARQGARAGAITMGDYASVISTANEALTRATLPGIDSGAVVEVTINGSTVTDDESFRAAVSGGASVAVRVKVPYSGVSWLPQGVTFFLASKQMLVETAVMCREG